MSLGLEVVVVVEFVATLDTVTAAGSGVCAAALSVLLAAGDINGASEQLQLPNGNSRTATNLRSFMRGLLQGLLAV